MTYIHHYDITEYIHCPKNCLYSTYSYPPTPHSPITPWQPMILTTFFIRVGIMLVIETEVTEIGASIIFSVASSHWIQCRNNLPKTWILVCPYYKWLLCSKALFSLISIILFYIWGSSIWSSVKLIHFSILRLPTYVLMLEQRKYWAGKASFFHWILFYYFKNVSATNVSILWKCVHRKIHPIFLFSQNSFPLP